MGADGWLLVKPPADADADGEILLYNSDGSIPEISGNGTRCAAAFLIRHGYAAGLVRIRTGAGIKTLRLLKRASRWFDFEMNMGKPEVVDKEFSLQLASRPWDVTILQVGNPQCAVPVADFDFDWRSTGAEIEAHPYFPNRTNVSFFKQAGPHAIDARFYERGAGETMSSGTGSTGAAVAAMVRGMVSSPVTVLTPAGEIHIRWDGDAYLTGPAEIVAVGEFFMGE